MRVQRTQNKHETSPLTGYGTTEKLGKHDLSLVTIQIHVPVQGLLRRESEKCAKSKEEEIQPILDLRSLKQLGQEVQADEELRTTSTGVEYRGEAYALPDFEARGEVRVDNGFIYFVAQADMEQGTGGEVCRLNTRDGTSQVLCPGHHFSFDVLRDQLYLLRHAKVEHFNLQRSVSMDSCFPFMTWRLVRAFDDQLLVVANDRERTRIALLLFSLELEFIDTVTAVVASREDRVDVSPKAVLPLRRHGRLYFLYVQHAEFVHVFCRQRNKLLVVAIRLRLVERQSWTPSLSIDKVLLSQDLLLFKSQATWKSVKL